MLLNLLLAQQEPGRLIFRVVIRIQVQYLIRLTTQFTTPMIILVWRRLVLRSRRKASCQQAIRGPSTAVTCTTTGMAIVSITWTPSRPSSTHNTTSMPRKPPHTKSEGYTTNLLIRHERIQVMKPTTCRLMLVLEVLNSHLNRDYTRLRAVTASLPLTTHSPLSLFQGKGRPHRTAKEVLSASSWPVTNGQSCHPS